jgi:hypothetical protein
MDWSESWRDAFRVELRAEAVGLAYRGWPVIPASYPDSTGSWLTAPGEAGDVSDTLRPVHADWQRRGPIAPERVAAVWSDAPYGLLVATGEALDAVEVSDRLGRRVAAGLREDGVPVPMVATPDGRWLFLTEAGSTRAAGAAEFADYGVKVHGTGSYIPVPPTLYPHGIVHWRVKPEVAGWRLPAPELVLGAVVRALGDPASLALARPSVSLAGIERLSA